MSKSETVVWVGPAEPNKNGPTKEMQDAAKSKGIAKGFEYQTLPYNDVMKPMINWKAELDKEYPISFITPKRVYADGIERKTKTEHLEALKAGINYYGRLQELSTFPTHSDDAAYHPGIFGSYVVIWNGKTIKCPVFDQTVSRNAWKNLTLDYVWAIAKHNTSKNDKTVFNNHEYVICFHQTIGNTFHFVSIKENVARQLWKGFQSLKDFPKNEKGEPVNYYNYHVFDRVGMKIEAELPCVPVSLFNSLKKQVHPPSSSDQDHVVLKETSEGHELGNIFMQRDVFLTHSNVF